MVLMRCCIGPGVIVLVQRGASAGLVVSMWHGAGAGLVASMWRGAGAGVVSTWRGAGAGLVASMQCGAGIGVLTVLSATGSTSASHCASLTVRRSSIEDHSILTALVYSANLSCMIEVTCLSLVPSLIYKANHYHTFK